MLAHQGHIGAELGGLGAIHLHAPLDAGQGPGVLGVQHAGDRGDELPQLVHGIAQCVQ